MHNLNYAGKAIMLLPVAYCGKGMVVEEKADISDWKAGRYRYHIRPWRIKTELTRGG
jgi:hypothetical protein